MGQSDKHFLAATYFQARNKYRPRALRVLIIAEAPPCALDRFFYFEDVKRQDSLFLEIMGILYPDQKAQYLASGRETELKQDLLQRFQSDGYWLLDLCEVPTSVVDGPLPGDLQALLKKLEKLIDKDIPIVLIKTNVYQACFEALKANGYNVIDEKLPFPGSGQQRVFREKFKRALEMCE
jgi:hypothetical protein